MNPFHAALEGAVDELRKRLDHAVPEADVGPDDHVEATEITAL